jgi:hypothetical protein
MPSRLTKAIITYSASTAYVGSHHIIKVRTHHEEEATETAVKVETTDTAVKEEAEGQWYQRIIDEDTRNRKREFHKDNEKWAVKVYQYEQIMRKQDEELRELERRNNIDASSAERNDHGTLERHNVTSVEAKRRAPTVSKTPPVKVGEDNVGQCSKQT